MEEDILNYLPTVMFRGTPCTLISIISYNINNVTLFKTILKLHCS